MINRFDFEQKLMECWCVTDDIKCLNEYIMDKRMMTEDEISNYLLGIQTIYQVKFEQLFDMFSKMIEDGQI